MRPCQEPILFAIIWIFDIFSSILILFVFNISSHWIRHAQYFQIPKITLRRRLIVWNRNQWVEMMKASHVRKKIINKKKHRNHVFASFYSEHSQIIACSSSFFLVLDLFVFFVILMVLFFRWVFLLLFQNVCLINAPSKRNCFGK